MINPNEYYRSLIEVLEGNGYVKRDDDSRFLTFDRKLEDGWRIAVIGVDSVFIFDDDGKSEISEVFLMDFNGREPMVPFRKRNAVRISLPIEDLDKLKQYL